MITNYEEEFCSTGTPKPARTFFIPYTKPVIVEFKYMQNTQISCMQYIFDRFYIILHLYKPSFNILTSSYIESVGNIRLLNCFDGLELLKMKILSFCIMYFKNVHFSNEKCKYFFLELSGFLSIWTDLSAPCFFTTYKFSAHEMKWRRLWITNTRWNTIFNFHKRNI